ncbi:MAG: CRISPR-associated helicase Cas3' [Azoarcus sp.]|nr:CRISPR-associated helicase Cas3' [Azoarcus sp.]
MKNTFSSLFAPAVAIWAKSDAAQGHPLLAHWLDVAAVVECLLEIEPESTKHWASKHFGLPSEHVVRWVAALAGLHDFGKAIPGFQAKWPEGKAVDEAVDLTFNLSACRMDRHDLATAALLGSSLHRMEIAEVDWLRHIVQAVSAHHGYPFSSAEVNGSKPKNEPKEWLKARQTLLTVYWQALAPHGKPAKEELSLPIVNWLAGLTSAADWIASNPEWFPLGTRGMDALSDYYANARCLAKTALNAIGWKSSGPLGTQLAEMNVDALISRIAGCKGLAARPLQVAGNRLLQNIQGPVLLLVEAPMGEGKTELAFLAHLRMQAINGHRGLYVALPTQATSNAMFKRALCFLENFGMGQANVQLIHGGAMMKEDIPCFSGIGESESENVSASAWFSQRRRPLLSSYGVGTVDQALLAVLNVKHHFVRLWGLGNRVVVLDEIHAYDTYTSGLIAMLLRWLKALGCSVVLMSATLPRARRDELLAAWGVKRGNIPELPYPRLMLADNTSVRGEHFEARPLADIHLTGLDESLESMADKAIELLTDGGCGAVIVNTVDRAQKLYLMLRERLGEAENLLLFHARFPADERAEHERRVLNAFGADGARPERALLVATQVVEQSLDLDFDFMLSDLAPIDLLLQRAGRLHRHARKRPAVHGKACLYVAGLQAGRVPELKETAWGFVYDAYILGRTWALLCQECVLHLPEDIDRLVQAVYDVDAPLPDELDETAFQFIEIESYGEYRGKVKKERQEATNIAIDLDAEPQNAYAGKPRGHEEGEGLGLENKTRLGRESITLIPFETDYGSWPFRKDVMVSNALAKILYNRQLKTSRKEVVGHFKSQARDMPEAFRASALLKHAYPLPLRDGRYEMSGLVLRLDQTLGLVYETASGA